MKGLILKDLYSLSSYWKSFFIILTIFFVTATWQGNYTFFASMSCIIIMSSSFNTFSYDEFYHWDEFSITLPMTKSKIIKAKYATVLLLGGSGILISIVYYIIMAIVFQNVNFTEFFLTIIFSMLFSCYFVSVCVPTVYKFGHEKMRIFMTFIIAIPVALFIGILYLFADKLEAISSDITLTFGTGILTLLLSALLASAMLFVSYRISVGIFEKKEF